MAVLIKNPQRTRKIDVKNTKKITEALLSFLGFRNKDLSILFVDNKGRILTCGTSPSHAISQKTLEDAVYEEANEALQKIGFRKEG